MTIPESIIQYEQYVKETPKAIADTYRCKEGLDLSRQVLSKANRIFFAGSGSSIPSALLGPQLLMRYTTKAGIFAPSSLILDKINLTDDDVVVLVTQGWNRADAVLITRKVLESNACLIVVTGHPEQKNKYTTDNARIITVPILPTSEKIFCRPATAATGYVKVAQLVEEMTGLSYSEDEWLDAYAAGASAPLSDISDDKKYVVLASSLLLCGGNNVALSLREGAGRYGTLQETESYGHGLYVPDQVHKNNTHYIILVNDGDSYCKSAADRIMPMLQSTKSDYEIWRTPSDAVLGNVTIMARVAKTIQESIRRDKWDMNNPPGMEGNRTFHVLEIERPV